MTDWHAKLLEAVKADNLLGVQEALAEDPSSLHARDKLNHTALICAGWYGKSTECATLLLQKGANVNARDDQDGTALMAAGWNHPELVKLLLEYKADMEAVNKHGDTALLNAIDNHNMSCVGILLEAGVDIYTKDKGYDALIAAVQRDNVSAITLLLAKDASTETNTPHDFTPLMRAAERGNDHALRLLLAAGAALEPRDEQGKSACDYAEDHKVKAAMQAAMNGKRPTREEMGLPEPSPAFHRLEWQRRKQREVNPDRERGL